MAPVASNSSSDSSSSSCSQVNKRGRGSSAGKKRQHKSKKRSAKDTRRSVKDTKRSVKDIKRSKKDTKRSKKDSKRSKKDTKGSKKDAKRSKRSKGKKSRRSTSSSSSSASPSRRKKDSGHQAEDHATWKWPSTGWGSGSSWQPQEHHNDWQKSVQDWKPKGKGQRRGASRAWDNRDKGWNKWQKTADPSAGDGVIIDTPGPVIEPVVTKGSESKNDYWSKAIENALNDERRIAPANQVVLPTLEVDRELEQRWDSSLPTFDSPTSVRSSLVEALGRAGIAPECFNSPSLEWSGAGYGAIYIPLKLQPSPMVQQDNAEHLYVYTVGHGTTFSNASSILYELVIRPQAWQKDTEDLPNAGFFGQAVEGPISDAGLKNLVRRLFSMSKGQQGAIIIAEARSPIQHSVIQGGGTWIAQNAARFSGLARTPEAWVCRSDLAALRGIATVWPA